jgi:hypothetical protein
LCSKKFSFMIASVQGDDTGLSSSIPLFGHRAREWVAFQSGLAQSIARN